MQFANPMWLWALSGLLIPIGIHLFSRKEGKVIPIGSIRYLRETATARHSNLRLTEAALLLLRCLLIALIVCLLAGAELSWSLDETRKWLLIEPGLEKTADIQDVMDEARAEGFEIRSFSEGFPPLSDDQEPLPAISYWSALRRLASRDIDSAVVVSYDYQQNFRGPRTGLPSHIRWISYPPESREFVAQALSISEDSVILRRGETSPSITRYETITAPVRRLSTPVRLTAPEVVKIRIFADEKFRYDKQILQSALQGIQSITPHTLSTSLSKTDEPENDTTGVSFWLSDKPPPGTGKFTFAYHACNQGNFPLITASSHGIPGCHVPNNVSWVITQRLTEENVLREHFSLSLAQLILPSASGDNLDHRVLPEAMTWSSAKNLEASKIVREQTGNSDFLIVLSFVLLLLTERVLSFKRN